MIKKKFFTDIIEVCEDATENTSKKFRVIVFPLYFFVILLFMGVLSPFVIIYKIFKKENGLPFNKVETELVTKWYTESSESALQELREWCVKLKEHPTLMLPQGASIEPYGRFRYNDYRKAINMLYQWELQHHNYKQAVEICDEHLEFYKNNQKRRKKEMFQYWAVQKAQIINALHGNREAQKFLFEYLDPNNRNCKINLYFEKLRSDSEDDV